ncbi:MAG: hypothetical protein IJ348_06745 [Alistipes sp.]|nr:hypothetical protein [Alistipes sp.]
MKKFLLLLPLLTLLSIAHSSSANHSGNKRAKNNKSAVAEVGKPLSAWSEGCLDIHFINSGRGECCFYILPDGTTLLVDAGEVAGSDISVAQRPNEQVRPYITYATYIKHFLPSKRRAIDYCAPSHLHTDHIGSADMATETSPAGYRKSGLLSLYDEVPYKHIIDRCYPNYTAESIQGQLAQDWATFVGWGVENGHFTAEQVRLGEEQIKMLNKPKRHKEFSILNICANGLVWGRDKSGATKAAGKLAAKGGNPASCGFHIRYGAFDYIACGDLTSSAQNRVAYYYRDFIGSGRLDAFKCHHHLAGNSWGTQMQNCNFEPRVIVGHCFAGNKPHPEKLAYILRWAEGFFATNMHPDIISCPEVREGKLMDKVTGYNGHIVLRVAPKGESFSVYMLDDSDFEYRVKSIHGPYESR